MLDHYRFSNIKTLGFYEEQFNDKEFGSGTKQMCSIKMKWIKKLGSKNHWTKEKVNKMKKLQGNGESRKDSNSNKMRICMQHQMKFKL